MTFYKITIRLEEPLTIGANLAVGNQISCVDYIPATTLRGGIAAALFRKGRGNRVDKLFGGTSLRWMPAWPTEPGSSDIFVPMPSSFFSHKDDEGFDGLYGVMNALECNLPSTREEYKLEYYKVTGEEYLDDDLPEHFQWNKIVNGWLQTPDLPDEKELSLSCYNTPIYNTLSISLNYANQTSRQGALFSRDRIKEKLNFTAYVSDPNDIIQDDDKVDRIFLGRRRNAGNGASRLEWIKIEDIDIPPFFKKFDTIQTTVSDVIIQLLTPAIVPAPCGGLYHGLGSEAWTNILKTKVTVKKAFSTLQKIQGWSGEWGLPREQAIGIAAGSCFKLEITATNQGMEGINKLIQRGLGVRTGEGFGWVTVNPFWLVEKPFFVGSRLNIDCYNTEGSAAKPLQWHTLDDVAIRESIVWAQELAEKCADESDSRTKLKKLAEISARIGSSQHPEDREKPKEILKNYLEKLARRTNPHGWDKINVLVNKYVFDKCTTIEEAVFVLSWASIFAKKIEFGGAE